MKQSPQHSLDLEAEIEKSAGRAPPPPADEQDRRLNSLREALKRRSLDGMLIFGSAESNPEPIRYLAGYVHVFPSASSFLVVGADEPAPILLIDQPWHLDEARRMSWVDEVRAFPNAARRWLADDLRTSLGESLSDCGVRRGRLGICENAMPTVYAEALGHAAPGVELLDATEIWAELVASPSEYDREMIRRTAAIADEGLAAVSETAEDGAREYEVCVESLRRMAAMGAEFLHGSGVSTHINIGSHSDLVSNVRPFLFSANRLERGQMFWVDLTASYAGYYIDCDRTIAIGAPTAEQQKLYDITASMYAAMLDGARPGVTGGELWEIGDSVVRDAGYADFSNHVYLGHTTGAATSQRPVVAPGESRELRAGSFLNVEPGVFVPGLGSACIENTLEVLPDGAEAINDFGIEMRVV